jgi:hypothetical protein
LVIAAAGTSSQLQRDRNRTTTSTLFESRPDAMYFFPSKPLWFLSKKKMDM